MFTTQSPNITLDLCTVKKDVLRGISECSQRGLQQTVKWLSELNYALRSVKIDNNTKEYHYYQLDDEDYESYVLWKSYFDVKEYDRAGFFTQNCTSDRGKFLHYYARYLSNEKKKLDNMTDVNCPVNISDDKVLKELYNCLKTQYADDTLDGYCLYLFGVILHKVDLTKMAIEVFTKAVNAEPLLWCAWFELGKIVPNNKAAILDEKLPDHWMKYFYYAYAFLEHLYNDDALHLYKCLLEQGLTSSTYLMAQIAIAHHNRRDLDEAISLFKNIITVDPYRLENLDTYSNLLYVGEMKTELADLAHNIVTVDKYRVETCCVIGNYYSLRSDHAKAVLYFRRALKLNPQFLSAWTLMGHEYMEMKNTNAAIQSYRWAIEINNRDYRAWYGLGQTYEILKMYFYSLYYYKKAQQLKPNDSRMIIALGETYEKLDKIENALKCYYKACSIGDIEGLGLVKLAKLYDKLREYENAAAAYTEYCLRETNRQRPFEEQAEFYVALQYLANYHLKKDELDDAYTYAFKCMDYEETKQAGKALLKAIALRRADIEGEQHTESSLSRIHEVVEEGDDDDMAGLPS